MDVLPTYPPNNNKNPFKPPTRGPSGLNELSACGSCWFSFSGDLQTDVLENSVFTG